ncbi:MAG: argininosuccinate lyase [Planctomycetes bacterium]|nr:argininosuccinate lyase [Planctomycetota bacterium]
MSIREGRFDEDLDPAILALSQSISFDRRLGGDDVEGSLAHAEMLHVADLLSAAEWEAIRRGLEEIREELERGTFPFDERAEDIHMNVEKRLAEKIGAAAGKLHTARSRNDQVALDLRLFVRRATREVKDGIRALAAALIEKAERHAELVLPAYTHLQRAQPVLLAHHLLAHVEMLLRDLGRFADAADRADECPLGSGACTGTGLPIDREFVRRKLGFARLTANSLDAVADRDFVLEFEAAAAILAVHLSRLAEEIVLWSTAEFGFVRLPDSVATGSSMMPQKKNPDGAELVRGKSGRIVGHLVGLLTVMKGLPLSYNRDLQEDKEGLFDTFDTLALSLAAIRSTVEAMEPDAARMRAAALDPASMTTATDLAESMVARGVPFREAHRQVGALVRRALGEGKSLGEVAGPDAPAAGDVDAGIARKDLPGGTAPSRVRAAIAAARARLAAEKGDEPRTAEPDRA